jgi:hypothetical protein
VIVVDVCLLARVRLTSQLTDDSFVVFVLQTDCEISCLTSCRCSFAVAACSPGLRGGALSLSCSAFILVDGQ